MKAWFVRLRWKLRGRRQVRIQLVGGDAIDGILLGVVAGHYQLAKAYYYAQVTPDRGEEMLGETWIPKERVFLLNVKPS